MSKTSLFFLAIALMSFPVAGPAPTGAGEKTLVLSEHLDKTWTHELVTFPFSAPRGQCAPASLALSGPKGPVPVQAVGLTLWPDTSSVQSCRLAFVVEELTARATNKYTVSYGLAPAPAAPASDLKVTAGQGDAEIVTSRFGVRLLQGEKVYDEPAPAAEVPGPVRAFRLADGTWFGGSRLYGPTRIKSWRSAPVESGPVFVRAETTYVYADGNTLVLTTLLAAGDYALQFEMAVRDDRPDDGWELVLGRGVRIAEGVKIAGSRKYAKEMPLALDPKSTEPACYLSPWPCESWFPDSPGIVRLKLAGRAEELHLSIRDAGTWVNPRSDPPWRNFARWMEGACAGMWSGWESKQIPLLAADGGAMLRINLLSGRRKWTLGQHGDAKLLLESFQLKTSGAYTPLPRLDEVKDMVLDWPDQRNRLSHPHLFGSTRQVDEMGQRNPHALQDGRDVAKLRQMLDRLGELDYMRNMMDVAVRYDLVIDSGQLSPEDRKLVKAQAAMLAYLAADPFHWSLERGYCSGNPNMTVSRLASLAFLGCALGDHPMSKAWCQPMLDATQYWLSQVVDESGSWPESAHYARVSWADFVMFAVVARQTKLVDLFTDVNFKRMGLFYEKTLMPPHPLRPGPGWGAVTGRAARVDAAYGRGTRNDAWGLNGVLAAATAKSDPAFSRIMQWSWRESAFTTMCSHAVGGMHLLMPNTHLPWERPNWRSEYYPSLGVLARSFVGDPLENYLLWVTRPPRSPDGEIWPADVGAIANWYAYGQPIGGSFPRTKETSHPLAVNRVALALNWDPAAGVPVKQSGYVTRVEGETFVVLPQVEYARARFLVRAVSEGLIAVPQEMPAFPRREKAGAAPLDWQRQLLQVTDARPEGVQYLVLRDTVAGGQPTQWEFWTLSEKVGTPREAAGREAFLKETPGYAPAPLRELRGDRFTALGQFGVDLEYFVAGPADTPRHTLRFGVRQSAYGVAGSAPHYQDLLYLQLPGDGCYFVVLFPRRQQDPVPEFAALGGGRVVKIAGRFGADYCFLSEAPAEAGSEDVTFSGTAACVQNRADGLRLVLSASGSVRCRDYGLASPAAAEARISPYVLSVSVPSQFPGGTLTVSAPGTWKLAPSQPEVVLDRKGRDHRLTLPPGLRTLELVESP